MQNRRNLFIAALTAMLAACLAAAAGLAFYAGGYRQTRAKQIWQQRQPANYRLTVEWQNGWSFGVARVEVRGGSVVAVRDPASGQQLALSQAAAARYFGSVDKLFEIIDVRVRPEWEWRNLLARFAPALARKIDPCVAPLSRVSYDQQLGYPSEIWYNDSWCATTFFNYSHVKVSDFEALP